MTNSIPEIKSILDGYDDKLLEEFWGVKFSNKYDQWIELVVKNSNFMKIKFDIEAFLKTSFLI